MQYVATGIRGRFASATERKRKAEKSVEAGREFVEAYVQYTHYLEGLHRVAAGHVLEDEQRGSTSMEEYIGTLKRSST